MRVGHRAVPLILNCGNLNLSESYGVRFFYQVLHLGIEFTPFTSILIDRIKQSIVQLLAGVSS